MTYSETTLNKCRDLTQPVTYCETTLNKCRDLTQPVTYSETTLNKCRSLTQPVTYSETTLNKCRSLTAFRKANSNQVEERRTDAPVLPGYKGENYLMKQRFLLIDAIELLAGIRGAPSVLDSLLSAAFYLLPFVFLRLHFRGGQMNHLQDFA